MQNDGGRDAFGAVVRDLLARNNDGVIDQNADCPADDEITFGPVPGGGSVTCIDRPITDGGDYLEWTGVAIPADGTSR